MAACPVNRATRTGRCAQPGSPSGRATEADLEATWQFRRLPEVCEWLTLDASDREEYTARFLSESRLSKTLIVELDGQVIGDLMLVGRRRVGAGGGGRAGDGAPRPSWAG